MTYKETFTNDVNELKQLQTLLQEKIDTEQTLLSCLQTLNRYSDTEKTIHELLKLLGNFYEADRAYILETQFGQNIFSTTYEWHRKGIEPKNIVSMREIENVSKTQLHIDGRTIGYLLLDYPRNHTGNITLLRFVAALMIQNINHKNISEQLVVLNFTDKLTGLGNRHKYTQTIEQLESKPPIVLGLIHLDVNGLKENNDAHGQAYGDYLLIHTAQILKSIFQKNVYRIGGDEFAVICTDLSKEQFDLKVNKLRSFMEEDEEFQLAIGSSWNDGRIDIDKQLQHTDELMRIDKQSFYTYHKKSGNSYHATLSNELLDKIEQNRFVVYLQPKINLDTGDAIGAEALIRQYDAEGNLIPPVRFIPRYEAEGIIRHLDLFVFQTACSIIKGWEAIGVKHLHIAVNLSRITLMEHEIVQTLVDICENYQVDPSLINIEVTESIGTMDPRELKSLMARLHESGFYISLDDFGSEYSNLAILTSLDFNEIKLDKSLISHLDENQRSRVITEHTIRMCQDLNLMTSVAEGIETPLQRDILKNFNCSTGQGFYFDKPMPVTDFTSKYITRTALLS